MNEQTEQLQWFRLYAGIVDDEKLRLLAFEDRWHYVALLALKCDGLLDKGLDLPMLNRQVAVKLGLQLRELEAVANRLEEVGLIDAETFQPLAWGKRQFRSDSSAERTRAWRARKKAAAAAETPSGSPFGGCDVTERHCDVTVTPPETETETDTETRCVNARERAGEAAGTVGTFEGHAADARPDSAAQAIGTAAGHAAAALNRAGCRVVSQNPNLLAALAEGVTVELLLECYGQYPDKPAGYVIQAARRIHAEQASPVQPNLIPGAPAHANPRRRAAAESVVDRFHRVAAEAEQRERAAAPVIDGHAHAVAADG